MKKTQMISTSTRNNWWVDLILFMSGIITFLSGFYFFIFPVGGYQGGRNPFYGIVLLFERHTWSDLHLWSSLALLAIAAIHIPLHWSWIITMGKRVVKITLGQSKKMNPNGTYNLVVNIMIALSVLCCGISGLYFLLIPGAAHNSHLPDPYWLFSLTIWDIIHTWSGIFMVSAALLHIAIHWKWVTKVTRKLMRTWFLQISDHIS